MACFPKTIRLSIPNALRSPQPRKTSLSVWPVPISLAATFGIEFSLFSCCYLDVSVHSVPFRMLLIYIRIHEPFSCGFPHSDILGSMDICSSPRLFAAYHVLRRLPVPRHSPCALFRLTYFLAECSSDTTFLFSCFLAFSRLFFDSFSLYSVFKVQTLSRPLFSFLRPLAYNTTTQIKCQHFFAFL